MNLGLERFHLPAECSKNSKIGNFKQDRYTYSQTIFNSNDNLELHHAISTEAGDNRDERQKIVSQMINVIITRGVDINARNSVGETALMLAIKYKFLKVIKLLVDVGIDVNIPDHDQMYPVHRAFLMKRGSQN